MGALLYDLVLHSGVAIEYHCSAAALDVVDRGLENADADDGGDYQGIETLECIWEVRHSGLCVDGWVRVVVWQVVML